MSTITAKKAKPRNGDRITLHFSALPDREFGPYPLARGHRAGRDER